MSVHEATLQSLFGRMFEELSANYGGVMISIGHRLGLYRLMAEAGPLGCEAIAERSGCATRYIQEWLASQVAGGCVAYDPEGGTCRLTPEQAAIFADPSSSTYLAPAWQCVAALWAGEERTLEAFRTGRGVAWGEQDKRMICGSAAFYRNGYAASLVQDWLPALSGVVERLEEGCHVADIGCGHGHSTLLMAEAFPDSRFIGIDADLGSIAVARQLVEERGLAERVSFVARDARELPAQSYDLICFFDCLHDMGFPVETALAARRALRLGGSVLLVEPYARDRLEDNVGAVARTFYAASTAVCCAHAISEAGSHVLGAQAGFSALRGVLEEAGFGSVSIALETPFNLVIEARA
ncbi:methyltransferase [Altererythrobacter sp. B11]|uniref:class I SAM-dependent methyltransferase n=1 Tax=Altererythrobacter sp. B11 TaxID=2060312 RepID=UPI000DC6D9FF|nr:class I SAM-dependent methyltransferase [Altererythrobacter sp. B11]BBC72066.1 methyltransferase [Altererythrobacter sp. B11]